MDSTTPPRTPESVPPRPAADLAQLIERHAPAEGANETALPDLLLTRSTRPTPRSPVISQPSICIVAQGSKRAYLGSEVYTYDPLQYLVLSVPLAIDGQVVEASQERPYLSLRLSVDPAMLSELLYDLGEGRPEAAPPGAWTRGARRGLFVSRLDERLYASVRRLVVALDHPLDPRILGRELVRETLYHVLTGEQGDLLRAVAVAGSRAARLAGVLRHLQTHFHEPLDVAGLAGQAAMSPTTLHHHFRAVTSSSPMQYLKTVRLHQALRLMLHEGLGAAEAAFKVGYGSPSQFSREFKRLFGAAPREQVARLSAAGPGGRSRAVDQRSN